MAPRRNIKIKILLSGGGTGGSVAPLLAVVEELNNPPSSPFVKGDEKNNPPTSLYKGGEYEFLWLGTKNGVEREMVREAGIEFKVIAAGKWRRYFSFKNFLDLFKIKIAFWQSFWTMLKWRPNLVMSAGSFISVPVVWAAWLLRVPATIHQQDVRPGLANKLMAPFAKVVTVTFEKSLRDYGKKAVWTGNPIRQSLKIPNPKSQIPNKFQILNSGDHLPIVLILGGGTGARAINLLVEQGLEKLTKFCQVIHVTGKNKGELNNESRIMNYGKYEFLDAERMAEALKLADVAVTRAGMSALSELSFFKKPCIIVPLPDSHQEENAAMFREAAVVMKQKDLTPEKLVNEINNLLVDEDRRRRMEEAIGKVMKRGAGEAMAKIIFQMIK